jgi:signal transduction histidine kinase
MNKRSIRTRWTFSLISLALLPLLILGIIISWKSYSTQIELTNKYQHEVARRVLGEVQLFIHELETIFKMTIKVNNLNTLSPEKQASILAKLQNIREEKHVNLIEELSLVDRSGREKVRIDRIRVYGSHELREMSNAEIFQQPMRTGKVYYSSILINQETGEPFMSLGIPTMDLRSGKIDGVLIAKVRMHAVWDMLTNVNVGQTGEAYLVDLTGRVVAHKNRSLVLKGTEIGASADYCHIEKGLEGGYVLRACELFRLGKQELRLVTDIPLSEALSQTLGLIKTIAFFIFLSFAAAIFLGIIVQRNVIRPIVKLSETAKAITDGDLDIRADIHQEDEIGSLANAFNTMATRLIETIDRLLAEIKERKKVEEQLKENRNDLAGLVDEATSDLSESNLKLQEEIRVRARIEDELNNYKSHLEELVRDRTTELIEANKKLQEEMSERKRASEVAAVMEERSRLARELHDSVSQSLYSLTLFAETGRQLVEKGDLENLRHCFTEIVSSSQVILKEMRLLMFDLRPAALEEEGLLGALRKRLDSVEQRSGVKAVLNMKGEAKLAPAIEEGIYRIAQEALNNSLKYSSASNIVISIEFKPDEIVMQISDDGEGFIVEEMLQKGGMGLTNMQERAAKLGGSLDILSTPGEGTNIKFSLKSTSQEAKS